MNPTRHFTGARRQRGQAVVWFLATIAACCCVFALVYNVGQMTNKKEEAVNAADAAALSGALVEARMLNFEAYANRAMIANEVTVAQLVSAESFADYCYQLLQNLANYTEIVPFLDDATSALADGADVATNDVIDPAVPVLINAVEGVNTALSAAREYANAVGAIAANDISGKVATANSTTFNSFGARYDDGGPQAFMSAAAFGLNETAWMGFRDEGDGRAAAKDLILSSRDPFSTQRDPDLTVSLGFLKLGIPSLGPVLDVVNLALASSTFAANGGTEFDSLKETSNTTTLVGYDHWAAQDSLDVMQNTIKFCFVVIPCGYFQTPSPADPPLGYGHADADADGSVDQDLCNQTMVTIGVNLPIPTVNCTLAVDNAKNISWQGIPQFHDLKSGLSTTDPCSTNNGSDSPSLPYVMAVQKSAASVLTTQELGAYNVDVPGPQGSTQMTDNLQGKQLTSVSAACVFFLRPDDNPNDRTRAGLPRPDGQHEYASLYNPYWQARLTTPDPKWTAAIYIAIGKPELSFVGQ